MDKKEDLSQADRQIVSADGTLTYYSHRFNACYHSLRDGALQESLHKHVYPPMRIHNTLAKDSLCILDLCFGLGYNSFCTAVEYPKAGFLGDIEIISPEIDRSVLAKISDIATSGFWQDLEITRILDDLEHCGKSTLKEGIYLSVIFEDAFSVLKSFAPALSFDVIYHDAFSKRNTPEFWTYECFSLLFSLLADDGILTSYSTSRPTIEVAKEAGFFTYILENPSCQKSAIFSKIPKNDSLLKEV